MYDPSFEKSITFGKKKKMALASNQLMPAPGRDDAHVPLASLLLSGHHVIPAKNCKSNF